MRPRAVRNAANSALVTLWRSIHTAATYTRCSGPSSGAAAAPAVQRTAPAPVARTSTPVRPVSTAAADCGTNGDRVMRIAKPGLIGALLGAGAGAATGAIADGGKAAGKGALIGGLAGTALGAGYGAYQTKNECGTVFNFNGNSSPSYAGSSAAPAPQAALSDGKDITVYNVR